MMEEVEQKRGQMMAELLEEIEITRKKRQDEMEEEFSAAFKQAHHTRLVKLAET